MGEISLYTRQAFREHLTCWTLRTIRDLFDAADIPETDLPEDRFVPGERRSLVERYYAGVDWSSSRDRRKVIEVYERILGDLDEEGAEFRKLTNLLRRDGYRWEDGRLVSTGPVDLAKLETASQRLDGTLIRDHLRRIQPSVEADPDQAIGSAKELLETVAKAILEEHKQDHAQLDTVQRLVKEAMRCLDLTAEQITDATKGADSIKKALSGLSQIVAATAELRNLYGTGHGRTRASGMRPRHARLVVGAVSTLCHFLLETLDARREQGAKARP